MSPKELPKHNLELINKFKPKIAIIAPPFDSVPTKSGNAIYTIVEQIARLSKYKVILFSFKSKDENISTDIKEQIIYFSKKLSYRAIIQKIFGYRILKKIYGHSSFLFYDYYKFCYKLCSALGIRIVLQEEMIDILNKKYHFHGTIVLHIHAITNLNNWRKIQLKINEVIFVSNASYNYHKNIIKCPYRVIYNGIDLEQFRYDSTNLIKIKQRIDFLFVGRLISSKGILLLIKAFSKLTFPNISLSIIGDPEYQTDALFLDELFKNINKDKRIFFIGRVEQKRIFEYYNMADFVVCPSVGQEGLPKVITEALAMGRPVISSDRGGVKELIIDNYNGLIINDPINEFSIYEKLVYAIQNLEILRNNAFANVEIFRSKFSLQQMIKQFDEVFFNYLT